MSDTLFLDLGLISVDMDTIIKLLKQDVDDDWFQDPLFYEDRLNKEVITKYFFDNIQNNHGEYSAQDHLIFNVPKSPEAYRYSLETSFFDRVAYFAFALPLIQAFDEQLSRRVLSFRLNPEFVSGENKKFLYLHGTEQWAKFEGFTTCDAKGKYVLTTDIQNYYENIDIELLKGTLFEHLEHDQSDGSQKAKLRHCINILIVCLKKWAFRPTRGLPQNRDVSSFLGNVYLSPLDYYLEEKKYDFYRYSDDIRVLCDSENHARFVFKEICIKLRSLNLSCNPSKTKIVKGDVYWNEKSMYSVPLSRIETLLKTKRKPHVYTAYSEIKQKAEKLLQDKELKSPEFRYVFHRLTRLARCREITLPNNYLSQIGKDAATLLNDAPQSDILCKFLSAIFHDQDTLLIVSEYLMNSEASIFEYQNYMIWKMLVCSDFSTPELITHAQNIILSSMSLSPDIAGALLYRSFQKICNTASEIYSSQQAWII